MPDTFHVMRYEGDDKYSWAVFQNLTPAQRKESILFWPAQPVVSGISRDQARYYKQKFETEFAEKQRNG